MLLLLKKNEECYQISTCKLCMKNTPHNEVRTADIQGLQREFMGRMEKLLIKIPKGWKFLMYGKCVEQAERSGAETIIFQ